MLTIKYETTFKKDFKRVLRQHRTKTALRRSATSACIFSVILHKNPSTYVSMPSEFLYNLTKNLTAHLRHYLCAVLPKIKNPEITRKFDLQNLSCCVIIKENNDIAGDNHYGIG